LSAGDLASSFPAKLAESGWLGEERGGRKEREEGARRRRGLYAPRGGNGTCEPRVRAVGRCDSGAGREGHGRL
jgi:hypothetical protein